MHPSLNVHTLVLTSLCLRSPVPPGRPSIDAISGPSVEGDEITLRCRCDVGKPIATLTWVRQRIGDSGFRDMVEESVSVTVSRYDDGTSSAVSELRVHLTSDDDGAVFRCVVKGSEDERFDDKKVVVLCE